MTRFTKMGHLFVERIPERLEEGIIYVAADVGTVVHRCCCGCGSEVVTPLGPTDWLLTYDGQSISLSPSIGNWAQPCRSHYWIKRNQVVWARSWSQEEVDTGRRRDRLNKERQFSNSRRQEVADSDRNDVNVQEFIPAFAPRTYWFVRLWQTLRQWVKGH